MSRVAYLMGRRVSHPTTRRMIGVVALAGVLVTGASAEGPQQRLSRGTIVPRQPLGLFEGPDRDAWQRPDEIMDALGIADGSTVADLWAGSGWFVVRLARRVGPNGRVYAEDIHPRMIDAIERRIAREGLGNVRTILGTPSNPRLPRNQLDAALIVNAFGRLAAPVPFLRSVAQALRPRGRLGVIDFSQAGGGPGPPARDRVDLAHIERAGREAGLRFLTRETFLPYQYLLVFSR